MKVFLGGTCNESTWREELIPLLKIDYFNPVVKDWTPECQERELHEREVSDFCLYVITPRMIGTYAIAELIDDSNKRPEKTVICFLRDDGDLIFDNSQWKSLNSVKNLVDSNGGTVCQTLGGVANYLNETQCVYRGGEKTLHNSTVSGARQNVKDINVVGNGDMFRLLCKASSEREGWMKSTKAMDTGNGCVVQVTTQQRNIDGSYSVAEAVCFVPGVRIINDENNGRKLQEF